VHSSIVIAMSTLKINIALVTKYIKARSYKHFRCKFSASWTTSRVFNITHICIEMV
jgi:hypothetical protein